MASEWAEEADRQARAITRDLSEVGRKKGCRVEYQKREARFALRVGAAAYYFSAHDYQGPKGVDWLRLRIDILTRVKDGAGQPAGDDERGRVGGEITARRRQTMSEADPESRNTGAGGTTGSESGPTTGAGGATGNEDAGEGFGTPGGDKPTPGGGVSEGDETAAGLDHPKRAD